MHRRWGVVGYKVKRHCLCTRVNRQQQPSGTHASIMLFMPFAEKYLLFWPCEIIFYHFYIYWLQSVNHCMSLPGRQAQEWAFKWHRKGLSANQTSNLLAGDLYNFKTCVVTSSPGLSVTVNSAELKLSASQPGTYCVCAHICCFWLTVRWRPLPNSLCQWLQLRCWFRQRGLADW